MTHSEWGLGCRGPEGTDERMDTTPRDTLREETERTTRRHLRGRGTAEARLPANSAWTRGRGERARAAAGPGERWTVRAARSAPAGRCGPRTRDGLRKKEAPRRSKEELASNAGSTRDSSAHRPHQAAS